jgi:uridine kinase
VRCGDESFAPNELRLMRRLVRDRMFRGTSAEFTFRMWNSVRRNEDAHIFPYAHTCGYSIDSSFSYEVGILKPYLEKFLTEIPPHSEYIACARDILDRISGVREIPTSYLSENSLYREFV